MGRRTCRTRWPGFGVRRHEEPIEAYPLKLLDTGITYTATVPGQVPQIEEREAARFSGYTWRDWQALPYDERVDSVAYFRVRRTIDMNQDDARERKIKSDMQKKPRGRR